MSTMWFGTKYLVAVLFACEINGLSSHLILNSFSVKRFSIKTFTVFSKISGKAAAFDYLTFPVIWNMVVSPDIG